MQKKQKQHTNVVMCAFKYFYVCDEMSTKKET